MCNRFCDEIRPDNQPRIHVDESARRTRRGCGGLSPVAGEAYLAGCALPCARSHPACARSHPASARAPGPAPTLCHCCFRRRLRPCSTDASVRVCLRAALPRADAPRSRAQGRTQDPPGPRRALALFPARQASPEGLFVRLRPRVRTLRGPVCERPNLADRAMPLLAHSHQRYGAPKKNLTPRARSRSYGQMPPNADNCRTFRRAPQRRHPSATRRSHHWSAGPKAAAGMRPCRPVIERHNSGAWIRAKTSAQGAENGLGWRSQLACSVLVLLSVLNGSTSCSHPKTDDVYTKWTPAQPPIGKSVAPHHQFSSPVRSPLPHESGKLTFYCHKNGPK